MAKIIIRLFCAMILMMNIAFTACEKKEPAEKAGQQTSETTTTEPAPMEGTGEKAQ